MYTTPDYFNDNDNSTLNEVNVYFDDILRNKEMIKEMFKTNILVYEDKIKLNNEKLNNLKEDLNKINSDFNILENRLKLEYVKNHDEFQKHDINFKLLDKTNSHYRMLIREREEEIKKIEEQTIFAHQDYQNKKIKLDCMNVQIVEAEFQLGNLQKKADQQINQMMIEQNYEKDEENEEVEYSKTAIENLQIENEKNKIEKVDKKLEENKSNNCDQNVFFDSIMNSEKMRPNKCLIF